MLRTDALQQRLTLLIDCSAIAYAFACDGRMKTKGLECDRLRLSSTLGGGLDCVRFFNTSWLWWLGPSADPRAVGVGVRGRWLIAGRLAVRRGNGGREWALHELVSGFALIGQWVYGEGGPRRRGLSMADGMDLA